MAAQTPLHPDGALSLALALVASSNAPVLLLDGDLTVLSASASFSRAFGVDPNAVQGPLSALGQGEWGGVRLRSLLTAIVGGAEIDDYEMDLIRPGQPNRSLVLHARKLDYDDESVRVLLSASDVTVARAAEKLKDDLLREKVILLQELQHRVANSLQIIASVILQSARRVKSEETRTHLIDAHSRVMSVASVQRQLAASTLGEVELAPYFKALCDSLGASMIRDHDLVSLTVTSDDSASSPDVSVSLGLIVTELVINALKHAFPRRRHGQIVVDYQSTGADWSLSVADDGVGMPKDPSAKSGLGTSIVKALATQLNAEIRVTDASPGTRVTVGHVEAAAQHITPAV